MLLQNTGVVNKEELLNWVSNALREQVLKPLLHAVETTANNKPSVGSAKEIAHWSISSNATTTPLKSSEPLLSTTEKNINSTAVVDEERLLRRVNFDVGAAAVDAMNLPASSSAVTTHQALWAAASAQETSRHRAVYNGTDAVRQYPPAGQLFDVQVQQQRDAQHALSSSSSSAEPINTSGSMFANAPQFLQRLTKMLMDKRNSDVIEWTGDGHIRVNHPNRLESDILPAYFESCTNRLATFHRQLYYYGFRKNTDGRRKGINKMSPYSYANSSGVVTSDLQSLLLLRRGRGGIISAAASSNMEEEDEHLHRHHHHELHSPTAAAMLLPPPTPHPRGPLKKRAKIVDSR